MHIENEKLIKTPVKDFAKKVICDGHLFLTTKEGRRFYLMKPGIFIDQSFIKKHASLNTTFDFLPLTNQVVTEKFSQLFKELRYLRFEKDLRLKAAEVIHEFQKAYADDEHFLSFALACFQEFNQLPNDVLIKMHETDLYLLRKALYSSAFSVLITMTNDYYHFMMIRDIYNLTFALDVGLCDENYSYFVAQACNQENQQPGTGKAWLVEQRASESESKVFLEHPQKSYQFLKENLHLLSFPELKEIALYQHELANGEGFPRGVHKGQVSSWEAIVILADSLIEIKDDYDFETKVMSYLTAFENKKLSDLPINRVYKKLCLGLGLAEFTSKEAGA